MFGEINVNLRGRIGSPLLHLPLTPSWGAVSSAREGRIGSERWESVLPVSA